MQDRFCHLYDLLSDVVGSDDVIKTRRELFSAETVLRSYKDTIFLPSGSKAEGLDMQNSDYDVMFMAKNIRVFESANDIICNNCYICLMDCHDTKLGFTRLRVPDLQSINFFNGITVVDDDVVYLSRLLLLEKQIENNPDMMIHGPCLSLKSEKYEFLKCLRCHEWITAARPWITRPRGRWPCLEVINNITDFGVLFVPVGCKNSANEEIEWRISFSIAEKALIHSFTHTQFVCYAALKMILSDIIKPKHGELLCSYFLKTIMFWLAEEINQAKWIPSNFVWCLGQCLKRLLYCVTHKWCLHYFIPEINFFKDKFTASEQKQLVLTLTEINKTGVNIIMQTATMENYYSETITRGQLCSSFISVYRITKLAHFSERNARIGDVIEHIFFLNSRSASLLFSEYCGHMSDRQGQEIDVKICNKLFYRQYKNSQTWCSIGLSSDAVAGWCKVVSLFYRSKQYTKCKTGVRYCLSKCTPDKLRLSFDPYITNKQRLLVSRKYFLKSIRHCVLDEVIFRSENILPEELVPLFREQNHGFLVIPAAVYLHFLDSLCAYHQGNYLNMVDSVRCLELAINENYSIHPNESQMSIAQYCLNAAQSLLHDI